MNKEIFIFPICESNHFKIIIWDNINRFIFEIDPLRIRTTDSKRLRDFIDYIKKRVIFHIDSTISLDITLLTDNQLIQYFIRYNPN